MKVGLAVTRIRCLTAASRMVLASLLASGEGGRRRWSSLATCGGGVVWVLMLAAARGVIPALGKRRWSMGRNPAAAANFFGIGGEPGPGGVCLFIATAASSIALLSSA